MEYLPHEKQIQDYVQTLERLKEQHSQNPLFEKEISDLEKKLCVLKDEVYKELTAWQRVLICRHPARPHSLDMILGITDSFHELFGDRTYRDDPAIVGGLAEIAGKACVVMGQEKGFDTESRMKRNFGMLHPEGFRKALRLMKLAEKFSLPVISFLDTPGAYPGLEAEERGQGLAIAQNLFEMAGLRTPIIAVVIGEGCSGGALGMGVADTVAMLEHAYYSVISPEGCASILWKDAAKNKLAAEALKMNAENLKELGIIDAIIKEPQGGAHHDPETTFESVKAFVLTELESLSKPSKERLLEKRYKKFRKMGRFKKQ